MEQLQKLEQRLLEMQIELANLAEKCNNLEERFETLSTTGQNSGIYLDGVPEVYRRELMKELESGKR